MAYTTARKRAEGLGAAQTGTAHHWRMITSAVGLLVLVPLFVFTFGPMLGAPYKDVIARFSSPFPAIVAGLALGVGLLHFRGGVQTMIEDYVQGVARKVAILVMICVSYAAAAAGIFAVASIAL